MSMIMVLLCLGAILISAAGLLRSTEASSALVSNKAFKEASIRAGEVGLAAAFQAVRGLVNEEANAAPWYFATVQPSTADGLINLPSWDAIPQTAVGNYQVQWVVDRMCEGVLPIVDIAGQCQVSRNEQMGSNRAGSAVFQSPPIRHFRVTARITGPKSTEQFVQMLVAR